MKKNRRTTRDEKDASETEEAKRDAVGGAVGHLPAKARTLLTVSGDQKQKRASGYRRLLPGPVLCVGTRISFLLLLPVLAVAGAGGTPNFLDIDAERSWPVLRSVFPTSFLVMLNRFCCGTRSTDCICIVTIHRGVDWRQLTVDPSNEGTNARRGWTEKEVGAALAHR